MPCPGQSGPPSESPANAACRTAWYNAVADAWEKYADEEIDINDLQQLLDAANEAFRNCTQQS